MVLCFMGYGDSRTELRRFRCLDYDENVQLLMCCYGRYDDGGFKKYHQQRVFNL